MEHDIVTVGWREWVTLPELGLLSIKAKVDTGARTSCLHAFSVSTFEKNNTTWVRFGIHPYQDNTDVEQFCEAEVTDERYVTDSGGHKEKRYVISTLLVFAGRSRTIEITLTNRDTMKFRMLLGRTALTDGIIVNPSSSFLLGTPSTL